jgi:hypothetical protein
MVERISMYVGCNKFKQYFTVHKHCKKYGYKRRLLQVHVTLFKLQIFVQVGDLSVC